MKPTDLTTDYWLHGLGIRSEIELPEPRTAVDNPDLEILREPSTSTPEESPPGTPVADFEIDSRQWYVATAGDDGFMMRFPGIADFLIDAELSTIRCRPDPHTEEGLLPLLSSGTVLSFLLSLRGECVLHASAVEEGGRAIAVAGLSGAGKSTCAALLCASGARLVTDDVLRVKISNPPITYLGSSAIRIRKDAEHVLDLFSHPPQRTETWDGRLAVWPSRAEALAPVGTIVIPRPDRERSDLKLEPVPPARAVFLLSAFSRIPHWHKQSIQQHQLDQLASLVSSVPVVEAAIPWDPPFSRQLADSLLRELADLARTGGDTEFP